MFRAWMICSRPGFSAIVLPGHCVECPWQHFGRGGCCKGGFCEERPGLPLPDTAKSSRLQPTHCKARLSPSANLLALCDNVFKKEEEMPDRQRRRREQKAWEIPEYKCLYLDAWAYSLLLLLFSPWPVLLRWGPSSRVGVQLLARPNPPHTFWLLWYRVRREPEERLCMFGGNQGNVKSHPFPPCSFLRGAAEHAHTVSFSTRSQRDVG